jgi:hypothetical protein
MVSLKPPTTMLTIQNLNRIQNQKVNLEWDVASIYEASSTYRITIRSERFPYQKILELSRIGELQSNGNYEYFFINGLGRKTHTSLRLEQIGDMNNILGALNWFTT